jgi:DNA-binding CsgD family transcriptional regulator
MMRQPSRLHDMDCRHDPRMIAPAPSVANALCELLGQLGTVAILVGAAGEIVGASAAAGACLGRDLLVRNARLATDDPRTHRALTGLIDRALHRDGGSIADAVVVERRNCRPLVLRAVPLDARAIPLFRPARAMVIVLDATRVPLPTEAHLGSMFALSQGEARLARRLAAGDTLARTAQVCGISYETARKRLKAAFAKTDTRRQAELVALIVRIGSIFGGAADATAAAGFCEDGERAGGVLMVSDCMHR